MTAPDRQQAGPGGIDPGDRRYLAYLILGGLAALFCTIVIIAVIVVVSSTGGGGSADASAQRQSARSDLPAYWKVRRGDTYTRIAKRTGLTVDDLETFNPKVDPARLRPGQRLKLRKNVPRPRRRPTGPKWVTLRAGDSFGSVAAETGRSISRLQQLNPKLEPTKLQPGDRVRVR